MRTARRARISRGVLLGTLASLAVGLLGSWAGEQVVGLVAPPSAERFTIDFAGAAAAFVVGGVSGAFGRRLTGLLALWIGLLLAAFYGQGLHPPTLGLVDPLVALLVIATVGYGVGRMVDPIWEGRPT